MAVALALGCAACRNPPSGDASAPAVRDSLRPVGSPSLTGAEAALQERIGARYTSLLHVRDQATATDADLASAYGEVGKLLMGAEFLAESEPYFFNARLLAPRERAWPYYLGHLYRLQGDPEKAIGEFQRALAIEGDDVPSLVWLGSAYVDTGRVVEAERVLRRATSLDPRSVAARFWLGRSALASGNHAAAIEQFEAALAADPEARPVHYPLAMAYRAQGNATRAAEHLSRWKEGRIVPDDPLMEQIGSSLKTAVGYEVRGTRALETGDWREAAAMFRKGLEVAPHDATLHQNLGTALFLGGDAAGALSEFQEALRLSPGYARAHFSVGVLMDANGRDAEAIQRFTDAVKYDPGFVNARFSLAEALRRTGQLEASMLQYGEVLETDPSASQARFGSAMALVRLGRHRDARIALEQAVKAHPDQPGFIHALARVLAAAPDEAVRDGARAWTIVQRLRKDHGANLALMETEAMALAELGRFGEAAARQREALEAATRQGAITEALRANLALYESRMPCRQPWSADDAVHRPRATMPPK
jgi:tetratricopeptide (TPR) repeat protein